MKNKLSSIVSRIDDYFIGEPGEVTTSDRIWFYSANVGMPVVAAIFLLVI
ncbi:DEAD/DEAH box helicase family protein [Oceanobacillus picturae]|uniref:DEAD/DEAH box helicase family protein n=1 Tax=Oceanobacillus picturae TaxID=171693 RepID=A0A0U9H924_9BACI|nr:hypothetical protein [Oceanobacillus picturae]GAQ18512.1 DEAD/DEAH box helicase family protein [Oceanobacillus picturae]